MFLFHRKNKKNVQAAADMDTQDAVKAVENAISENIELEKQIISGVEPGSVAEGLKIRPGDELVCINGETVEDMFDYQYMTQAEELVLTIRKPDGRERRIKVNKDEDTDLGIRFENGLMDHYRHCSNHCIFCFIDQNPKGLRKTLYFKDDDARLSFLQGNYITLTNMSDHNIDRIIRYRLSPLNISFQTTNPELRCRMLNNRFAGEALKKVDRLNGAGITMNGQIVLCKGVNDGEELERSIGDLYKYLPNLQSVSVVPVGLTKFRDGLYPLEPFDSEDAGRVIDMIERWQKKAYSEFGLHFMHASDEWYLLAGRTLPEEERYDGYLQLENGVGMLRLLITETDGVIGGLDRSEDIRREVSLVCGMLAYPTVNVICGKLMDVYPGLKIHLYPIRNDFFGERITVSGLLVGRDVIAQLRGKELGEELLMPQNMFRSGDTLMLDDTRLSDVAEALQVRADIVKSEGQSLIMAILGKPDENTEE
jgi:putative radical SAM enzyme (TIGR03279 family)